MLDKDLFWLSFVIFLMFFKMQGWGRYEKEGLKGGLALNIFSKQLTSGKQEIPMEFVPFSELQEFSY